MNIEKIENGYIVISGVTNSKQCFHTIEEVFKFMLLHYEGKSVTFGGDSYGKVYVEYEK